MTLHNYQVWMDAPNLKQQYDFGNPLPWKDRFYALFGNPFVLFQVRDCLIDRLNEHILYNEPQPLYSSILRAMYLWS